MKIVLLLLLLPVVLSSGKIQDVNVSTFVNIPWVDVSWEKKSLRTPTINVPSFVKALPSDSCGGFRSDFVGKSIWGCKGTPPYDVYIFTTTKTEGDG